MLKRENISRKSFYYELNETKHKAIILIADQEEPEKLSSISFFFDRNGHSMYLKFSKEIIVFSFFQVVFICFFYELFIMATLFVAYLVPDGIWSIIPTIEFK